jgi:hypothetical protein
VPGVTIRCAHIAFGMIRASAARIARSVHTSRGFGFALVSIATSAHGERIPANDLGLVDASAAPEGRRSRNPAIIAACSSVSTKQAVASESDRIQATWSLLDVSYIGTVTAPTARIA